MDRLLSSPRYGERMAFRWLDAARYADTNGYQLDGDRSMWRWRDWVIEAFNRNLPFDRFVIEQLAGDLLPNPTLDQRIATAFNRNHRTNSEDGIVPEEYAVEYVVDRVDTTSTVFMGLTIGCARCHNHKFDPITQKEYYQLYAYFNNLPENGRVSNFGNAPPWIFAPDRRAAAAAQTARCCNCAHPEATCGAGYKFNRCAEEPGKNRFPQRRIYNGFRPTICWFVTRSMKGLSWKSGSSDEKSGGKASHADDGLINPVQPEGNPGADPQVVEIGFKNGTPKFVPAPTGQGVEFDGSIFFDAGKAANFDYRDRRSRFQTQVRHLSLDQSRIGKQRRDRHADARQRRGEREWPAEGQRLRPLLHQWQDPFQPCRRVGR